MNSQEIVDNTKLKLKKKVLDDFEIFFSQSVHLEVEAKKGKVDSFVKADTSGISIRILKGGKIGFSYSTDLSDRSCSKMVDEAINCASETREDQFYGFPSPAKEAFPLLNIFDEKLCAINENEKIAKAIELEKAARNYDRRITKIRNATYGEEICHIFVFNTRGIDLNYQETITSSSILAIAEDGSDSQMGWDFDFNRFFDKLSVEEVGIRAAARATEQLGARGIKTVRCPVLLNNVVSSEILGVLASSFMAENCHKGKTILKDKLGRKVFSSQIGIVDDGLLEGGLSTSPCDGEGTARQTTQLVEEGVITHFLYDRYYALKDGLSSTGNSNRSDVDSPPSSGVSNFFIKKGKFTPEELLSGIKQGFLITELMGVHTANAISGDFSLGASGFWIEEGKIKFPVKGAAVSGNIIDMLANVEGVADDIRFLGKVGAPSILINNMDISGE